ncbi:MAG: hypothetical protein K0R00_166 [Herbinix sp.]|jgi:hypothetical protein|nr:hypothetical protein [Herbinix sp.]
MADVTVTSGVDGVDSVWGYHDSHVTNLTDKNFLSAARCIIYARPTKVAAAGADAIFSKIGVIQGYNWSEQKQIEQIFELGSDIPYLIPGRTTGQISISRILIAGIDLTNLFYAPTDDIVDGNMQMSGWKRSLRDVTIPMDLLITYYDQASTAVYTRLFSTCWLQARNESINSGQIIVAENVNVMYQHVTNYSAAAGTSASNPVA